RDGRPPRLSAPRSFAGPAQWLGILVPVAPDGGRSRRSGRGSRGSGCEALHGDRRTGGQCRRTDWSGIVRDAGIRSSSSRFTNIPPVAEGQVSDVEYTPRVTTARAVARGGDGEASELAEDADLGAAA